MIPQRTTLITIGAWDVPKLRAFYKRLGWKETDWSSDSYAVFKNAGCMFSVWSIDDLSKDAEITVPTSPAYFRGVTLAINVETREQVDEVLSEAEVAGARINRPASDRFWGGRSGCFLDPENNAWEVAFNPNSVFDESGAMIEMNG
ncbi:VOC family protein [Alicyclobacillus mengziensis]|uniref:VOC family protein n=1 Tax=Alicyclobacillus mengziensis TaxID=2931921 RepID=A0A9X7Z7H6_9BACL|nr:VOC family protein [Alicyclobacillus mengziensis]QSO47356.1 VOC family protein [Alicyclobacillus mengziensis]